LSSARMMGLTDMSCDLAAWRLSRGDVKTHKHLDTAGLIFGFN